MKVDIIRSETIKPSTPTPQHLKTLKLSLLDQIAPSQYVSLVLFYSNDDNAFTSKQISQTLKKSLSETLVFFYPLAGKVNLSDSVVECDDGGATFVEAEFNGQLSAFLENRYNDECRMVAFLPPDFGSLGPGVRPLLVQVTIFACGGFSVGIRISHKLVDGATLALFLRAWATCVSNVTASRETKNLTAKVVEPDFECGSLQFPAIPQIALQLEEKENPKDHDMETVTRRFLFDKKAIAALKAKSASSAHRPPSRVEAVTALVWKCAAAAATCPYSVQVLVVNLRNRVDPPFPANAAGNLVGLSDAWADRDEEPSSLGDLVGKMRVGLEEFVENTAKKLRRDDGSALRESLLRRREGISAWSQGLLLPVVSTSWLGFGFYEVDLGFGKPAYVAGDFESDLKHNQVILLETRDGEGVEICLTLSKEIMASLECDPTFLAFVSNNNS